jgi:hypothetical protein
VPVQQRDGWRITASRNTRYRPWTKTFVGRILTWLAARRPD